MLVDLHTVMAYAEDHKIAIGSFNVPNLESIQGSRRRRRNCICRSFSSMPSAMRNLTAWM